MPAKTHSMKLVPAVKPVPAAAAKVVEVRLPTSDGRAPVRADGEGTAAATGAPAPGAAVNAGTATNTGTAAAALPQVAPSPAKAASGGCASKLRVLADPTRLAVLESLIAGPKHVGTLQKQLGVEQSLLSHHLQTLREAGLVESQRDGKAVLYRITPSVVAGKGEGLDLGCCVLSFND
jgi:DNA-binding transcriptional ArsR family regulator